MIFSYDDVVRMLRELPRRHVYAVTEGGYDEYSYAYAYLESDPDSGGNYIDADEIDYLIKKLENLKRGT